MSNLAFTLDYEFTPDIQTAVEALEIAAVDYGFIEASHPNYHEIIISDLHEARRVLAAVIERDYVLKNKGTDT